jgi:hypothetical protein
MPKHVLAKLKALEIRHPGVFRQVNAMFAASFPVHTISAALAAQYGEHVSASCLLHFKRTLGRMDPQRVKQMSAGAS